jgi:hypothetical protein
VMDVGETPRDRKVEKLKRVGSPDTAGRFSRYATLQGAGRRCARRRKREGGWPGTKPRARADEASTLKGNHGSTPRPIPSLGELRVVIEALKTAVCSMMGNRVDGTGKRAGHGKPWPHHQVGKLRSGNLVSAAGREPSRRSPIGSKPSSGSKPGRRIETSRKARRGSIEPRAVETQNLKRAIVNKCSSRGDRCAKTRRAGLTPRGMPNRMSDVRDVRRGRRKALPAATRKLLEGEVPPRTRDDGANHNP